MMYKVIIKKTLPKDFAMSFKQNIKKDKSAKS